MQEKLLQLISEIRNGLRFRWYGLAVAWIICLVGWGRISQMPNVYEGRARFYVDTSSALENALGDDIVAANIETQLAYIRETLLSRSLLEFVAKDVGLDEKLDGEPEQRERLLDALHDTIKIQSVAVTQRGNESIYNITYQNPDRAMAVGVVKSLLDKYIADTRGENERSGQAAEQFLDSQVKEYEARLDQADHARAEFRRQNSDKLPGADGDYAQQLQDEQDALATANRNLRILQAKRAQHEQQLEDQRSAILGAGATSSEPAQGSLDARIRDTELELNEKLLQFTERHPDIIALRKTLDALKAERAKQLQDLGLSQDDIDSLSREANPVFQALQVSLNETDIEIAALNAEIEERQQKIDQLKALIDQMPKVQAELNRLDREYEGINQQYLALVRSRETQQLAGKASDVDQIDFRIIDPPLASPSPIGPNRFALLVLTIMAGIGGGGVLCYVLAQVRPVFSSARSLTNTVGLPVLGTISHAWPVRQRAELRKAVGRFALASSSLLVVFCVLLAVDRFGPGFYLPLGQ